MTCPRNMADLLQAGIWVFEINTEFTTILLHSSWAPSYLCLLVDLWDWKKPPGEGIAWNKVTPILMSGSSDLRMPLQFKCWTHAMLPFQFSVIVKWLSSVCQTLGLVWKEEMLSHLQRWSDILVINVAQRSTSWVSLKWPKQIDLKIRKGKGHYPWKWWV